MARTPEELLLDLLHGVHRKEPATVPSDDPTIEYETTQTSKEPNEVAHPPITTKVTQKTLFAHPDSHPVVLDIALIARYGVDWLGWEPETIELRAGQDFVAISDLNLSKVMACKTLHLVDSYWLDWEVFNWCTMPFNSVFPDFDVLQVPTVAQCLVSVDIANRIRSNVLWSDEVKRFIETVYKHAGLFVPLSPTEFVTMDTTGLPLDVPEIKRRWTDVRASGKAPTQENAEDEQLRGMLLSYEHLEESRQRLRAQLPLVKNV